MRQTDRDRDRERERESVCVRACVRACVCGERETDVDIKPFLTGRMFVRESSWKYSANLFGS